MSFLLTFKVDLTVNSIIGNVYIFLSSYVIFVDVYLRVCNDKIWVKVYRIMYPLIIYSFVYMPKTREKGKGFAVSPTLSNYLLFFNENN